LTLLRSYLGDALSPDHPEIYRDHGNIFTAEPDLLPLAGERFQVHLWDRLFLITPAFCFNGFIPMASSQFEIVADEPVRGPQVDKNRLGRGQMPPRIFKCKMIDKDKTNVNRR
jgi:hypothetical protein